MNIAVYCGSSSGDDPAFEEAARDLGACIAKEGHTLVYGGSNTGLMLAVAESALQNQGSVIGVEVQILADRGLSHSGLTRLYIAEDLQNRRSKMIELGDVFIALPGGMGTLDEISEVSALARLGVLNKPCIALNINGYYDPLKQLFYSMLSHGFMPPEHGHILRFANSVEEVAKLL